MPPATLARHLGLVTDAAPQLQRRLMIDADPDAFAYPARLSPAEARALTLLDWRDRYQPIDTALALRRPGKWTLRGMYNWLYPSSLRHCPGCLAGDGSTIQNQYGGAWQRVWRLPIAFACTEHELFLSEGCGTEHAKRLGILLLMPNAALSELHPAQCRQPRPGEYGRGSPACGNRLDQPPGTAAPRPARTLLDAQRRILRHLGPDTPPRSASRFFADLRLVAAFLNVLPSEQWPAIDIAVHDAVASTLSDYLAPPQSTLDRAPLDVVSTATMLTAATTILDESDRQTQLFHLVYKTAHPNRLRALEKIWARLSAQSSPALQNTLVSALKARYVSLGLNGWLDEMLARVTPHR